MKDEHSWIPVPPPGPNRLRRLLENLDEPVSKLEQNILYVEGYERGKAEATNNYRKMMAAMAAIYQLDYDDE